ncbi:MAG: bifunctional diaminohydroxyphosphoribosylaminopyrimidine deaminase/5-amino-6-(5-phosphoribosylamino)uracil reductase RibD [Actinobacteria bacterium]|nr:bifunctional diaminohydroxyphosphoribosylaminopyrimidine deaminase/5-amino-6-(5-phosphoribosylamino)uracil reductase RibD [Actinomycetota bacterium]
MKKNQDFTEEDKKYMNLALRLAEKARGFTSPNPMVGAVIVKNGSVISSGYHKSAGLPHAEVEAVDSVNDKNILRGASLYVTLEPCSIYGKTPPCTDTIIKYGFSRVIIACIDPNPGVNGSGIRLLNDAGIRTETGLFKDRAEKLNEIFFKQIRSGTPFITAKIASSIDGKTAAKTKDSKWITGEKARKLVRRIRVCHDSVLTGINTVIADNPGLLPEKSTLKIYSSGYNIPGSNNKRIPEKKYFRIILDSGLRLDLKSRIVQTLDDCRTVVFCSENVRGIPSKLKKLELLKDLGTEVICAPSSTEKSVEKSDKDRAVFLDLQFIIEILYRTYGITSILLEAGKTVLSSFLRAGLIDKFIFFTSPKIIGGDSPYGIFSGLNTLLVNDAIRLRFDELKRVGQDIMITAYPCLTPCLQDMVQKDFLGFPGGQTVVS